jgi:hypothetical protein
MQFEKDIGFPGKSPQIREIEGQSDHRNHNNHKKSVYYLQSCVAPLVKEKHFVSLKKIAYES